MKYLLLVVYLLCPRVLTADTFSKLPNWKSMVINTYAYAGYWEPVFNDFLDADPNSRTRLLRKSIGQKVLCDLLESTDSDPDVREGFVCVWDETGTHQIVSIKIQVSRAGIGAVWDGAAESQVSDKFKVIATRVPLEIPTDLFRSVRRFGKGSAEIVSIIKSGFSRLP